MNRKTRRCPLGRRPMSVATPDKREPGSTSGDAWTFNYCGVYQWPDSRAHIPKGAGSNPATAPNSDALAHGVIDIVSNNVLGISSFSDCLSGLRAGSFFESSSQRLNETLVLLPKSSPGSLTRLFSELRRFAACVLPLVFSFNSVVGLKVSGSNPGHSPDSIHSCNPFPGFGRGFLGD